MLLSSILKSIQVEAARYTHVNRSECDQVAAKGIDFAM